MLLLLSEFLVFVFLSLRVVRLLFVPVSVFHIVCFIVAHTDFSGLLLPGCSPPLQNTTAKQTSQTLRS